MTISTANILGKPWVSPVFFNFDESYSLYWVSDKDSLHSRNIKERPQVGIVVFGYLPDGSVDGVYFDAEAVELKDIEDMQAAIAIYSRRKQDSKFTLNTIDQVSGDATWRIYKAIPKEVTKISRAKIVNGQYTTVREHVDL